MHDPETHLIPRVLFAAMGRQPSVKVFGSNYSMADGTCLRDYVHVRDLADAHVAALDWLGAGEASPAFNLGNGRGFSVSEVVQTARQVTGLTITTELAPRRPGDPPVLISDSSRARKFAWMETKISRSGSADRSRVENGFAIECRARGVGASTQSSGG